MNELTIDALEQNRFGLPTGARFGTLVLGGSRPINLQAHTVNALHTAASLDDALRYVLRRWHTGKHYVILGNMLSSRPFQVYNWGSNVCFIEPSVVQFTANRGINVAAIVINGATGYFPSDLLRATTRWVQIPRLRAFYSLAARDLNAQRRLWINGLNRRSASITIPGARVTRTWLQGLSMPELRLLAIQFRNVVFPVRRQNPTPRQPRFRGAYVLGFTLPLLRYPIVEPDCYIRVISGAEGKMEAINAYDLGAGVSIGPIQNNVIRAALFQFLSLLYDVDPTLFNQTFGVAPNFWAIRRHSGHPDLVIRGRSPREIILHGTNRDTNRNVGYFQSGTPGNSQFAQIDQAFRTRMAQSFREVVVWPHVQELIFRTASSWLQPGLDIIHEPANHIPVLNSARPDRDTFILKALLLSAYVRYSACLRPLLVSLRRWTSVSDKLRNWQTALTSMTSRSCRTHHRNNLRIRLARQQPEAGRVFDVIQRLAAAPSPNTADSLKEDLFGEASGCTSIVSARIPSDSEWVEQILQELDTGSSERLAGYTLPENKDIGLIEESCDCREVRFESRDELEAILLMEDNSRQQIAPMVVDTSVAVPQFSAAEQTFLKPIMSPAENKAAIRWNSTRHPSVSGVSAALIKRALHGYVNFSLLETVIRDFNIRNPGNRYDLSTGPFDAVFVEAIHQFQSKCFFESNQIDGKAGESTLDSLGIIKRSGMNSMDRVNIKAKGRLKKIKVRQLTGNEFTANSWFDAMVNPSFLGHRFKNGIHIILARKLRKAENWLLSLPQYRGKTPLALGAALGFTHSKEQHKGARPTATTDSIHTFGLATDILYSSNPWVRGAAFSRTFKRAALLVAGVQITDPNVQIYLHKLGINTALSTKQIYQTLSQRNANFTSYLSLYNNHTDLIRVLQDRKRAGTPGIFLTGESLSAAASRWEAKIVQDRNAMHSNSSPFMGSHGLRLPANGFLNLAEDLVIALRDKAGLAWGAVDLGRGSGGSGDMMHFDARVCGIGDAITKTSMKGQHRVTSGHPSIPCGGN